MKIENPTSRDIADLAGVSQATVSRALRNSPQVRPETRARIQSIAKELNYFVNRNAAGLRTHHSNTIALLLFDETGGGEAQINPFFLSMLGYITRAAARLDYDILISLQQLHDDWHIEYQASHRADGLILLGYGDYRTYKEKLDALARANTRFIIFGPIIKDQPGNSIGCDNVSGGFQATRHLLDIGRERIAFLGNATRRSPEFAERYLGYLKAHELAGVEASKALKVDADNLEELGIQAVQSLLDSGQQFDAIFAVTDVIAIGAMKALQKRGLEVPGDVSVVGFDDLPLASHVTPALTTVRQDIRLASERLVEGIVGLIEAEPVTSTLMEPTLVVRSSCGGRAL
jgi:DNA-binding LacI/PurR family transcriptional regulator